MVSLSLFNTLVDLHCEDVMFQLVFRSEFSAASCVLNSGVVVQVIGHDKWPCPIICATMPPSHALTCATTWYHHNLVQLCAKMQLYIYIYIYIIHTCHQNIFIGLAYECLIHV